VPKRARSSLTNATAAYRGRACNPVRAGKENMNARLMPTLLISLALALVATVASKVIDLGGSPATNWFLCLLILGGAVFGGGWLFSGARTEWQKMSTPHVVCENCRYGSCTSGRSCPRCGRSVK
jgi:hypothetical protein